MLRLQCNLQQIVLNLLSNIIEQWYLLWILSLWLWTVSLLHRLTTITISRWPNALNFAWITRRARNSELLQLIHCSQFYVMRTMIYSVQYFYSSQCVWCAARPKLIILDFLLISLMLQKIDLTLSVININLFICFLLGPSHSLIYYTCLHYVHVYTCTSCIVY